MYREQGTGRARTGIGRKKYRGQVERYRMVEDLIDRLNVQRPMVYRDIEGIDMM